VGASTRPSRAPQIPKARATKLFIEAVIELLETRPIADISDQLIADTAGINRATIYRHFGTRFELLNAVVVELTDQWLVLAEDLFAAPPRPGFPGLTLDFGAPFLHLAAKLFGVGNYLTAANYQSDQVKECFTKIIDTWINLFESSGMTPRMARAIAVKWLALNLARDTASTLTNIKIDDVIDVQALTLAEARNYQNTEIELGWKSDNH
jgi:AcrR family transcriptional regulator